MYSSRLDLQLCTLEYTLEYLSHHCHENMMNACELLLMRARAGRAYCKKCRVNLGSKSHVCKKLWLAKSIFYLSFSEVILSIETKSEIYTDSGKYIRSGKIYLNQIFEFPRRPYCYLEKYRYSQSI